LIQNGAIFPTSFSDYETCHLAARSQMRISTVLRAGMIHARVPVEAPPNPHAMFDQLPLNLLSRKLNKSESRSELPAFERSIALDAPTTLFMCIQTADGPRTVIASNVSLAAATQISKSLAAAGHYAEFVDQYGSRENIRERLLRQRLERRFRPRELNKTALRIARA
jgi:hypothetical protein